MPKHSTCRTQRRTYDVPRELERVHQAARKDRDARFTALLHHVTVDQLRRSFYKLKKRAAPGIDKVTWHDYEKDLEHHLTDLHGRIHRGGYRAKAVRRTYIPKGDGRLRPLGVAAVEDKVAQSALSTVLNAVYEADFQGFSYGFRPGRSQHDALDAVTVGIKRTEVNWVLDADIRGCFDAIDHEWLLKFVGHRIGDKRVLRLIQKWLNAGIMEDGRWRAQERGTPQGATMSPLLANIYLHYAFDLWSNQWRAREAQGNVIIVRYADDIVVGFEHRADAERFRTDLEHRLREFGLELHPDKTRLVEFGRNAGRGLDGRGPGRPGTFDFLGFTHTCARTRKGAFQVQRKTSRKKLAAKLKSVRHELRRRWHLPVPVVGRWLRRVVQGYLNYQAIPGNYVALVSFIREVIKSWLWTLRRRGNKRRMTWKRIRRYADRWLPRPRILHPWPEQRLDVIIRGRSPVR